MNTEEFLQHYGKKGMKWGQRKVKLTSETMKTGRKQLKTRALKDTLGKTIYKLSGSSYKKEIRNKVDKVISDATGMPIKSIKRSSLKKARRYIASYRNVAIGGVPVRNIYDD